MAHLQIEPEDLIRESRSKASTYPQNLVYKSQYGHQLDALDKQLENDKGRVWATDGVINLRDLRGDNGSIGSMFPSV